MSEAQENPLYFKETNRTAWTHHLHCHSFPISEEQTVTLKLLCQETILPNKQDLSLLLLHRRQHYLLAPAQWFISREPTKWGFQMMFHSNTARLQHLPDDEYWAREKKKEFFQNILKKIPMTQICIVTNKRVVKIIVLWNCFTIFKAKLKRLDVRMTYLGLRKSCCLSV